MKITQYISHENVETLKDDRINSILIDDENNLWVSTNNNGLIKILVKIIGIVVVLHSLDQVLHLILMTVGNQFCHTSIE